MQSLDCDISAEYLLELKHTTLHSPSGQATGPPIVIRQLLLMGPALAGITSMREMLFLAVLAPKCLQQCSKLSKPRTASDGPGILDL